MKDWAKVAFDYKPSALPTAERKASRVAKWKNWQHESSGPKGKP
jgi:hypothetical protein